MFIECAIFHHKHIFANYCILKDIEYLQKQYIQYDILMNCTSKQTVVAINYIDASWTDDNDITDEPGGALDYSHANTDNDADFQKNEK